MTRLTLENSPLSHAEFASSREPLKGFQERHPRCRKTGAASCDGESVQLPAGGERRVSKNSDCFEKMSDSVRLNLRATKNKGSLSLLSFLLAEQGVCTSKNGIRPFKPGLYLDRALTNRCQCAAALTSQRASALTSQCA